MGWLHSALLSTQVLWLLSFFFLLPISSIGNLSIYKCNLHIISKCLLLFCLIFVLLSYFNLVQISSSPAFLWFSLLLFLDWPTWVCSEILIMDSLFFIVLFKLNIVIRILICHVCTVSWCRYLAMLALYMPRHRLLQQWWTLSQGLPLYLLLYSGS